MASCESPSRIKPPSSGVHALGQQIPSSLRIELLRELRAEMKAELDAEAQKRSAQVSSLGASLRDELKELRTEVTAVKRCVDQLGSQYGELSAQVTVLKYHCEPSVEQLHKQSSQAMSNGFEIQQQTSSSIQMIQESFSSSTVNTNAVGFQKFETEINDLRSQVGDLRRRIKGTDTEYNVLRDPTLSTTFSPTFEGGEVEWGIWRRMQEWWAQARDQLGSLEEQVSDQKQFCETVDTTMAAQSEHIASLRLFELDVSDVIRDAKHTNQRIQAAEDLAMKLERRVSELRLECKTQGIKLDEEASRWRLDALNTLCTEHGVDALHQEKLWSKSVLDQLGKAQEATKQQSIVALNIQARLDSLENSNSGLHTSGSPPHEQTEDPSMTLLHILKQRNDQVASLETRLDEFTKDWRKSAAQYEMEIASMKQFQSAVVEQMRRLFESTSQLQPRTGDLIPATAIRTELRSVQEATELMIAELQTKVNRLDKGKQSNVDSLREQLSWLTETRPCVESVLAQSAEATQAMDELRCEVEVLRVETSALYDMQHVNNELRNISSPIKATADHKTSPKSPITEEGSFLSSTDMSTQRSWLQIVELLPSEWLMLTMLLVCLFLTQYEYLPN